MNQPPQESALSAPAAVFRSEARGWRRLAAVCVALAGVRGLGPRAAADPLGVAAGLVDAEAPAHVWGLAVASDGLLRHGPFLRVAPVGWPGGLRADLADPASLLWFAPVHLLGGPAAAWNATLVMWVILAGWGGWAAARRLTPDPAAAAVCAVAVAWCPGLLGAALPLGRSEVLPMASVGLGIAAIHWCATSGRASAWLATALSVGLVALGGWSGLAFCAPVLGFALVSWGRRRPALLMSALAAPIAAVATGWWVQSGVSPWWRQRWMDAASPFADPPVPTPLGALLRLSDAQMGNGWELAPYPGSVLLGLCVVGLFIGGARARRWATLGGLVLVLALGHRIRGGGGGGWGLTAWAAHLIPPLRVVQGWSRHAVLAAVPLGICAGFGVAAVRARVGRRAGGLFALAALSALIVDGGSWAPLGRGGGEIALSTGELEVYSALPDGPVMELPGGGFSEAARRKADRSLLASLSHGHPTSLTPSPWPETGGRLLASGVKRGDAIGCEAIEQLRSEGFSGVLVRYAPLSRAQRASAKGLPRLVGEPLAVAGATAAYSLEGGQCAR